jgi:hypothetical protein
VQVLLAMPANTNTADGAGGGQNRRERRAAEKQQKKAAAASQRPASGSLLSASQEEEPSRQLRAWEIGSLSARVVSSGEAHREHQLLCAEDATGVRRCCGCAQPLNGVAYTAISRLPCGHEMHHDCARERFWRKRDAQCGDCNLKPWQSTPGLRPRLEQGYSRAFSGVMEAVATLLIEHEAELAVDSCDEHNSQGTHAMLTLRTLRGQHRIELRLDRAEAEQGRPPIAFCGMEQREALKIVTRRYQIAVFRVCLRVPERNPLLDALGPSSAERGDLHGRDHSQLGACACDRRFYRIFTFAFDEHGSSLRVSLKHPVDCAYGLCMQDGCELEPEPRSIYC